VNNTEDEAEEQDEEGSGDHRVQVLEACWDCLKSESVVRKHCENTFTGLALSFARTSPWDSGSGVKIIGSLKLCLSEVWNVDIEIGHRLQC
jgi:hypothetical protein